MTRTHEEAALSPHDRLLNVGDVARHLAVSRSKVYQLMDAGHLSYVKLGKSRRVRCCDVQKLVEQNLIGCE